MIADCLGIKKPDLKVDIFGDFRLLRHSIIHHRGIALPGIEKCKVLKWFNENDQIALTEDQIKTIIFYVKIQVNDIASIQ